MSCQAMVGTPPAEVILSRSISSKGAHRVPAAHHRQLGSGQQARVEDREASGGVEERHRQKGGPLRRGRIGRGRGLAPSQERAGAAQPAALMLELMLRWLARAPLGFPVVPEV